MIEIVQRSVVLTGQVETTTSVWSSSCGGIGELLRTRLAYWCPPSVHQR